MNRIEDFIELIKKSEQQNVLFHFTDERNLPSIREFGLLSKAQLEKIGVSPLAPGGNQWSHDADKRKGIYDFVSLCLLNQHPMELKARTDGRIDQVRFLQISPSILLTDGVCFSREVANSASAVIQPLKNCLSMIDFDVVYKRTDWNDKAIQDRLQRARKYEILVPKCVARDLILRGL